VALLFQRGGVFYWWCGCAGPQVSPNNGSTPLVQ
jgi:hypothetical protein